MSPEQAAFYQFHASLMEPWDGPASIAFTDGTVIGAVLDRNGLRPSRYWVTDDDLVIMATEVGVLDVAAVEGRRRRAGCSPGACSWSTPPRAASSATTRSRPSWPRRSPTRTGSTRTSCTSRPAGARASCAATRARVAAAPADASATRTRSSRSSSRPWRCTGKEAIGSMGTDTPDRGALGAVPPAVRLLQAAVRAGHQPAARRHPRGARHGARQHDRTRGQPVRPAAVVVPADVHHPTRSSTTTSSPRLIHIDGEGGLGDFRTVVVRCLYPVADGGDGLRERDRGRPPRGVRGHRRRRQHRRAVRPRRHRRAGAHPVAAAHRRRCTTTSSARRRAPASASSSRRGEAREVHHMCLLLGYGAGGHQPVPRVRDHRGPHRRGALPASSESTA